MKDHLNIIIDGLKQSANNDLEIIETMTNKISNILIFYHLEQAFEKLLKVLYLETNPNSTDPHSKIEKYHHKIDLITYDLIVLICDEYINHFKHMEITYPYEYNNLVKQIKSFKTTAENKKKDMNQNFEDYLKNYSINVNKNYNNFIIYSTQLQGNPQGRTLLILSVALILSSCLYKMNDLSRYLSKNLILKI